MAKDIVSGTNGTSGTNFYKVLFFSALQEKTCAKLVPLVPQRHRCQKKHFGTSGTNLAQRNACNYLSFSQLQKLVPLVPLVPNTKPKNMTSSEHKYILEPYGNGRGTRHTCPACHKPKEFTRYIDTETGQYLADHVGKCNRLKKCEHHFNPKQFFAGQPAPKADSWRDSNLHLTAYEPPKPDYIPAASMQATLQGYGKNNFVRFLSVLFGEDTALKIAATYNVGTSKRLRNDGGLSCIFWQVDSAGNVRQCKVMGYDPHTGKRLKSSEGVEIWDDYSRAYRPAKEKEQDTRFWGKVILKRDDANFVQCLFGEHLLPTRPDAVVCLVESEKSACIMSVEMPENVWLATGGKHGAKWTDPATFAPLAGRHVVLWPDLGAFDDWSERAKVLNLVCASVTVSNELEQMADAADIAAGFDIADYFIADKLHDSHDANVAPEMPPPAPGIAEQMTDDVLPPGFQIIEFENGRTLEIDGLPSQWLNDDERDAAIQRLGASGRLEVIKLLHPLAVQLIDVFGLEV